MTMKELREKLQKEIDTLKEKLNNTPENEHVERASLLGKIGGLLTACILSYGDI